MAYAPSKEQRKLRMLEIAEEQLVLERRHLFWKATGVIATGALFLHYATKGRR